MSAKAYYQVRVEFCIGEYLGDWDGNEEQMESQVTVLTTTESKKFAELLYKRLVKAEPSIPENGNE